MIEDLYIERRPYIENLSMVWDENIRFFEGDQHIYYNKQSNQYEVIPETKFNSWIPRPITNLILPIVMTIVSLMTKSKPAAIAYANDSNVVEDVNAAKCAEIVLDTKWEMDEEQILSIDAAIIALLCGTVIRKDYWDPTEGPKSEALGGKAIGDNAVEMLSPFEVIPDIEHGSYWLQAKVKDISWTKSAYNFKGNGYTGRSSEVVSAKGISSLLSYRERLRTSSGYSLGGSKGNIEDNKSTVPVECYIKPTSKHPNGLMVVECGGILLYVNDSPYYKEGFKESWHPYTVYGWIKSPLRWHFISLVENLTSLQKRLNAIDALIILTRMTHASPQRLVPDGCGIPEGYWDGRPGLEVPYRPVGANGAKPEIIPGIGLPGNVMEEREKCVREMHAIAMDNEVLGGGQPSGVNTAAALNMLLEQTFSKFSPFIQRWEKFLENGQQKKLLIIQKFYKEVRPDLIKKMSFYGRDVTDIEIQDFTGKDLRDNVCIRIEAGSSLPRSKVAEQAQLSDLAKQGLFGPLDPQQNPEGNAEFLKRFGIPRFSGVTNPDVEYAKYCLQVLKKIDRQQLSPEAYPQLRSFDNLDIHQKVLTDEMKKPTFKDLTGIFQQRLDEIAQTISQQADDKMRMTQEMMQQNSAGDQVNQGFPQALPPGIGSEGGGMVPPEMGGQVPNQPGMA